MTGKESKDFASLSNSITINSLEACLGLARKISVKAFSLYPNLERQDVVPLL